MKNKRKVVLLKYKNMKENIVILTESTKRRKHKNIKNIKKCNHSKEISYKKNVNRINPVNDKIIEKHNFPLFKAQLRNRIVPQCFRQKCKKKCHSKTKTCGHRYRNEKKKMNERKNEQKFQEDNINKVLTLAFTLSPISLSESNEKSCSNLSYDDISSASLSSYSGEEIDTLIKSTRERLKDLNVEWPIKRTNNQLSNSKELNRCSSLETLVLAAQNDEVSDTLDLNNDIYSPTKNHNHLIKCEPVEANNNSIYNLQKFHPNQHLNQDNNNIKKEYLENNKIEAVVLKLERNDWKFDSNVNVNYLEIKQELYGDL